MRKIATLTLIFTLYLTPFAKASHIAGADLTYTCLGNNQYVIHLDLFVDCATLPFMGSTDIVNLSSTCGGNVTATVNLINLGGTEISQLCPSQINNSTCNGGNLPGMWIFSYVDTVTLSPCDSWTMSWTTCCRNAAIINLTSPDAQDIYVQSELNSVTDACNSSPSFTSQPIPYVCVNQPVSYNYGIVESDGNLLQYSLIGAMDGSANTLGYNNGYSATSPIPGISIDPNTGILSFTPTSIGSFVVVVLVQEYDSNGNLVGSVMRDIQFVVQNCANVVPDPSGGAITNLTGSAVQAGPYAIDLCEGASFSFTATYSDTNGGDSLYITSNIASVLPGATLTTSGANPMTATVSWTAPGGSANTNTSFTITINDGACPVVGQQTFEYDVNVVLRTLTGSDQVICGTQTASLQATGGSLFHWNVISGPAMNVGVNFSCDTCANPVAFPVSTTTYEVVSNLSCNNRDTVTVTVVPDFSMTLTPDAASATTTCLLSPPIPIMLTASPTDTYTYHWSPSAPLSNATIPNPVATINSPGTYDFVATVTSSLGCVKKDTATIVITASYKPDEYAYVSDTANCIGDTVHLGVRAHYTIPSSCGTTTTTCDAPLVTIVGTGTAANTTTSYPAPYGNWYTNSRQQYLFRASELNAMGITAGKINRLDFLVTQNTGITTYHQYTINMGCTSLAALGSSFVTGLSNVFTPQTVNIATGWNSHQFTSTYQWDGISNLVVEICFSEGSYNYTYNAITLLTNTSYVSTLYLNSDDASVCSSSGLFLSSSNSRPHVRFYYCSAPDTTTYSYSWFPTTGISDTASQNPTVVAATPGVNHYYVVVKDTLSGCLDTAYVDVNVNTPHAITVDAGNDVTICPGSPTPLTATGGATHYSWTPTTALTSVNTDTTTANPTLTITYIVTGTAFCITGPAHDSVTVTVLTGSQLNVNAGDDQEICGVPYSLTGSSSGGVGTSTYHWDFVSGNALDTIQNSNTPNATVTPSQENTNIYQLIVTDFCGDTASDYTSVHVLMNCNLNIPNVFTPNGDGKNDLFLVTGVGMVSYAITIYDRWGKKVYESTDIKDGWTGKGHPDGTYYYLIKAKSNTGKSFDEKGYLQLLNQ